MATVTEPRPRAAADKGVGKIVDADVHPMFKKGLHDLEPYLSESGRRRLGFRRQLQLGELGNSFLLTGEYAVPNNVLYKNVTASVRVDSVPPSGEMPGSDPKFVAEQLLDGCDIHRAVLVTHQMLSIGTFRDPDMAAMVATAHNDWLQDKWLESDTRFRGAVAVAPQDPEAAAKEIARVADRPGVVAVFLPLFDVPFGERFYHPIYAAAVEHGLPVITHPSGTENIYTRGPRMAGTPTYFIEWFCQLSQMHHSNLISLVCQGIFERFPELKFVISEAGFIWAIETMFKLDNNYLTLRDEVPWLTRPPSEYIRDHVWFTTQPFPEPPKREYVASLMEMVHAEETLLYSSDYPHWDFDDPIRALAALPADLKPRVYSANAAAVFGDRLR